MLDLFLCVCLDTGGLASVDPVVHVLSVGMFVCLFVCVYLWA